MFSQRDTPKGTLDILLEPIINDVDEVLKRPGEPDRSFKRFGLLLVNGLYQAAIQMAEENNYPLRMIGYLSNGQLKERTSIARERYA